MKINLDWSSYKSVGRLIGLIGLSASHFGVPVSDRKPIRSQNTENLTNLNYLYKKMIKHQEEKVYFSARKIWKNNVKTFIYSISADYWNRGLFSLDLTGIFNILEANNVFSIPVIISKIFSIIKFSALLQRNGVIYWSYKWKYEAEYVILRPISILINSVIKIITCNCRYYT